MGRRKKIHKSIEINIENESNNEMNQTPIDLEKYKSIGVVSKNKCYIPAHGSFKLNGQTYSKGQSFESRETKHIQECLNEGILIAK